MLVPLEESWLVLFSSYVQRMSSEPKSKPLEQPLPRPDGKEAIGGA